MSLWTWESKLEDQYEKQIYKKIFNLTKSKTLALKASKNLGLFNYLKNNKFETSKDLRDSIFLQPGKKNKLKLYGNFSILLLNNKAVKLLLKLITHLML
jgi:hypothetical protein